MSELKFPQFNRLPFELRDAIWVMFALPRGPMLHSISGRLTRKNIMICSFSLDGLAVNPLMLPTTRALMQVSHEARKAVLAGRQLQRLVHNIFKYDVFLGGVYNVKDPKQRLMLHKFFFVNWAIDMFYFRQQLHMGMGRFLDSSFLSKVKRIAIDVEGPSTQGEILYAPNYSQLFGGTSISDVIILPSLDTIYLALNFNAVRQMYSYAQLMTDSESDSYEYSEMGSDEQDEQNEQDEEDDSEVEEELDEVPELDSDTEEEEEYDDIESSGDGFGSDDENDYGEWLNELPKDQFGFHHVEPETYSHLDRPLAVLFGEQWPLSLIEISFQDWVDQMVSSTKAETEYFCGRPIGVQMVMDVYGGICHIVGGYYRGYAGFIAVDEPVSA
ncbi:hypothetical protein F4782DRAFT_524762 [Xylaria castorea]|nr:hypothetical protein F4782DRAFT_524762 [Xylaria castorea]